MIIATERADYLPGLGLLAGRRVAFDVCEVAIAEQDYQQRVRLHLVRDWWWLRLSNTLARNVIPPLRVGYVAHNWLEYCRSGWYWRNQRVPS